MKSTVKIFILALALDFVFATSVVYADPIEGSWQVDMVKMKKVISSMPKNDTQTNLTFFITFIANKLIFHKDGKMIVPATNQVGTWKRMKKGYLISVDGNTNRAYLDHGKLKFIPLTIVGKQTVIYNHQKIHIQDASKQDAKIAKMIQYNRPYYRAKPQEKDTQEFLLVTKNNICKFKTIKKTTNGSSSSTLSDQCHVINGQLHMGPILGNAKVVSPKMIKVGKQTYILR